MSAKAGYQIRLWNDFLARAQLVLHDTSALRRAQLVTWKNLLEQGSARLAATREEVVRRRSTSTPDFNILKITHRSGYEVTTHSAFLAHLLDSFASHGQGNLFLRSFLTMLAKEARTTIPEIESPWLVRREVSMNVDDDANYGAIDLLLSAPASSFEIGVEVKIYAGDQRGQLLRYQRFLERRHRKTGQWLIAYLTLDGHRPTAHSYDLGDATEEEVQRARQSILLLTFRKQIRHALEEALPNAGSPRVRDVVSQYLETIRRH